MSSYINATVRYPEINEVIDDIIIKFPEAAMTETGGVFIRARGFNVHEVMVNISLKYDEAFIVDYSFEIEQHMFTHSIEYIGGKFRELGMTINYAISDFHVPIGYDGEMIEKLIIERFAYSDHIIKTDLGYEIFNPELDHFDLKLYGSCSAYVFRAEKRDNVINITTMRNEMPCNWWES